MQEHGNAKQNNKPHHLYEIVDKTDNDTVKYGIYSDELTSDGFSPRAEKQVKSLNIVVGWLRFFARILLTEITGRVKAKEIENQLHLLLISSAGADACFFSDSDGFTTSKKIVR